MLKIPNFEIPKSKYIKEIYQKLILFQVIWWMRTIVHNPLTIQAGTSTLLCMTYYIHKVLNLRYASFQHMDITTVSLQKVPLNIYWYFASNRVHSLWLYHQARVRLRLAGIRDQKYHSGWPYLFIKYICHGLDFVSDVSG